MSSLQRVADHLTQFSLDEHTGDCRLPVQSRKLIKLQRLIEEASWCWASSSVRTIDANVDPLSFFREYVHLNRPCIVEGVQISGWDPATIWERIQKKLEGVQIRVNATPTGRADACFHSTRDNVTFFAKPKEMLLPSEDFFGWLSGGHSLPQGVYYVSAQNNSLNEEFKDILVDSGLAPASLLFGDLVFGKTCDAANLWIGEQRSTTTIHRDSSYENLYCVLKGCKVFHLLPPFAACFLGESDFPNAQFEYDSTHGWSVNPEPGTTSWVQLDVEEPEQAVRICPDFAAIKHLVQRVEVSENQVLYLPAGWWHQVSHKEKTIACNYWYDREFNSTWILEEVVESLVNTNSSIGS